jgi:hypothetical protein
MDRNEAVHRPIYWKLGLVQKSKEDHEFVAPLGKPEDLRSTFDVTSMDKPVPYPLTSSKNKYLQTFLEHFTKYV